MIPEGGLFSLFCSRSLPTFGFISFWNCFLLRLTFDTVVFVDIFGVLGCAMSPAFWFSDIMLGMLSLRRATELSKGVVLTEFL